MLVVQSVDWILRAQDTAHGSGIQNDVKMMNLNEEL